MFGLQAVGVLLIGLRAVRPPLVPKSHTLYKINDTRMAADKSWIAITIAGTTAGICVASATYVAGDMSSRFLASSAGITIDAVGHVAGAGAELILGPAAGFAVRIATSTFARTTEATVSNSGRISAGVMAAAAGAITAMTITAGTRIIEYTVEYGGQLTREAALKLSETYIKYKASQSGFTETGDVESLVDNDWVIVDDADGGNAPEVMAESDISVAASAPANFDASRVL